MDMPAFSRSSSSANEHDDDGHDDFGGLHRDLPRIAPTFGRRRALQVLLGSAGAIALAACSSDKSKTDSSSTDSSPSGSSSAPSESLAPSADTASLTAQTAPDCQIIPQETAGPFPGDGSNGPNVLNLPEAQRTDITSSFAGATGKAEGVPLSFALTVTDSARGCAPMAGAAVYAWQCDREGRYSMYSPGVESENYLRGIGVADDSGTVIFTSIFPGAYPGRWPHIHFEVFDDVASASSGGAPRATSQLAFPADACVAAYTQPGYEASTLTFATGTLEGDNVFGDDGGQRQLATMAGGPVEGFTAQLTVTV
jgi:protocatechuate 3,4-dioxygenase beta subunit